MSWLEAKGPGNAGVVCRPVAPLRARPNPRSELVTQEIFGKHVRIEAVRADWSLCSLADSSRGWMPLSYLSVGRAYEPTHWVAKRFAILKVSGRSNLVLPMASPIQVTEESRGTLMVRLPDGASGSIPRSEVLRLDRPGVSRAGLARVVREVVGTPYLWGGKSTFGFDCSGLVQFIFELLGVDLPRNSCEQALSGRLLGSLKRLRPLDLVFFGDGGVIDHVAIHLGDLSILHASGHVGIESLDPGSRLYREDLRVRFQWARRLTL